MSNNDLAIVILAAGKGTRLKSSLAKVLHRAGGRTLVEHVVRSCAPLKPRETVVVVGYQGEQVASVARPGPGEVCDRDRGSCPAGAHGNAEGARGRSS